MVRYFDVGLSLYHTQSHADTLLYRGVELNGEVSFNRLNNSGVSTGLSVERRSPYLDQTLMFGLNWNQNDIHQGGNFGITFGRRAGEPYLFLDLNQGCQLTENATQQVEYQNLIMLTGNYDFTNEKSLGLLLIHRYDPEETDAGIVHKRRINVCLTYHQSVRSGTDIFFILGDPNGERIQRRVAVKLVRPFFGK